MGSSRTKVTSGKTVAIRNLEVNRQVHLGSQSVSLLGESGKLERQSLSTAPLCGGSQLDSLSPRLRGWS